MKYLKLILLIWVQLIFFAFADMNEYKYNDLIGNAIETELKLKNAGKTSYYSDNIRLNENLIKSDTIFFYNWESEHFSGKSIQKVVESLDEIIVQIENETNSRCLRKSFMVEQYAEEYSERKVPEFSLSFYSEDDKTNYVVTAHFIMTSNKTLAIQLTTIFPVDTLKVGEHKN